MSSEYDKIQDLLRAEKDKQSSDYERNVSPVKEFLAILPITLTAIAILSYLIYSNAEIYSLPEAIFAASLGVLVSSGSFIVWTMRLGMGHVYAEGQRVAWTNKSNTQNVKNNIFNLYFHLVSLLGIAYVSLFVSLAIITFIGIFFL